MTKTFHPVNDGIGLKGDEKDWVQDLRVYSEGGSVQLWLEIKNHGEFLQYLTPDEAIKLSETLKRLAIKTFIVSALDD